MKFFISAAASSALEKREAKIITIFAEKANID